MIDKIIRWCATNRGIVVVIVAVLVAIGVWSIQHIAIDALPDLSDTQVIIFSKWDRSPDIIEDQVTYPITTALLGAPHVKAIRGFSDFGYSYVYVIFDEGTDIYWARSRVLEYLSKVQASLPQGVETSLGPDATGVGWVFQYALVDTTGQRSLADLRSLEDWHIRYELQSVPGVAEVASVGGFVRQYQITVDPQKLASYGIPLMQVSEAVRKSNNEVGGRLIEWSGAEYMVRAHGYIRSKSDLEQIVLKSANGTPVRLADVADVQLGPELRRGIAELDGRGEVAGGVVVMRHGENAMNVIGAVKQRLAQIQPSLPKGVQVVTTYDRSQLIKESIHTLSHELLIEMLIVSLVILIFLWHIPSALIPIFTLPAAVILSFIPMRMFGINANIMSLGGIAVAIGALVDAAVVVVENSHKKLEAWESGGRQGDYKEVLITAIQEVGRPSFFSLLVIALSFMPIFALEAQEGKLFKPLAFTKNFSMIIAALLAITLDPALRLMFTRFKAEGERQKAEGPFRRITSAFRLLTSAFRFKAEGGRQKAEGPFRRITSAFRLLTSAFLPEERHPISRILFRIYGPPIHWVLRHTRLVIVIALVIVAITIPVYFQLGHEFMPPLNEGVILYMPTTLPGISVTEASALLQKQDALLREVPEIERVFGKAGRADTSTDPAPLSMMETTIVLKPESQWRSGMTYDRLINELDRKLQFPGQTNAWTMPIRNRIDMLTTGIRTPVGIKVYGADLKQIENIGRELERIVGRVPGTRSVYGERVSGGYFVDFDIDRAAIARYGLTIDDVQQTIMTAIGGENVSTTIEGRERYPINIRYPRELRDDIDKLGRVLVPTMTGAQIPLAQLASLRIVEGPAMIRDENGRLAGYVFIDVDTSRRDLGSFVDDAKRAVASQLRMPSGYTLQWSGQYEAMQRVKQRMAIVVPLTLLVIAFLIYLNTRSVPKTMLVLLAVPFSAVGAVWLLWLLGYNMSIGVWVGLIALLGLDAETGIFMLLYLDLAYDEMKPRSLGELRDAIYHGAVKRVRPKVMTVACAFFGLIPIMWSAGAGADVMKRIAAPMIGGLVTSFLMELLVYPAIYYRWKSKEVVSFARL
ncbi:MAG TPA: efflux RND transporter permease subunit [Thermoanaerobaculia bacterium]|nr:efflux RND transporter permease subunit [Thermoanaerobaculia bacterium]